MPHRPSAQAYAALALGVLAISWSAIFVRWTHMPGLSSAFYRLLLAALILWTILLIRRAPLHLSRRSIALATLGGIFFAGDVGLYNISVLRTSAGAATFLGNNAPLFVGLFTWALTRKLPSARFWIAFATALAGAALIVSSDLHHPSSTPDNFKARFTADILAVIASLCFALYLSVTENLRTPARNASPATTTANTFEPLTLLAVSSTASAATLLLATTLTHASLRIPSATSLAAVIGLGVVCQLVGYFCLTYALGHLPATVSSIVMLAVAPLTAILALLLFHEQMTTTQLLGGTLVLLGVWIVSRSHTARPDPTNLAT
jgi:drug/metabolite transporter (DMT)-like permease